MDGNSVAVCQKPNLIACRVAACIPSPHNWRVGGRSSSRHSTSCVAEHVQQQLRQRPCRASAATQQLLPTSALQIRMCVAAYMYVCLCAHPKTAPGPKMVPRWPQDGVKMTGIIQTKKSSNNKHNSQPTNSVFTLRVPASRSRGCQLTCGGCGGSSKPPRRPAAAPAVRS